MAEPPSHPDDGRAPWRVAFSVAFALSFYMLLSPKSQLPDTIDLNDKVVHGAIFAVLALTGWMTKLRLRPLVLFLVLYAVGTEVLQAVLPIHRDGDPLDALADLAGAAVGLAGGAALDRRTVRR